MDSAGLWIAMLSAFFAATAAIASLLQVRGAVKSTEVSVFLEFTDRYGQPEIRDAIALLSKFWRDRRGACDLGQIWLGLRESDPKQFDQLRQASRLVANHFYFTALLFCDGMISRRLALRLIDVPGLNVFYEVILPIVEAEQGPTAKNYHWAARSLRRLRKRVGAGMY